MKQLKTPFVFSTIRLEQSVDKQLYSSVSIDDTGEMYRMVQYLHDMGHEKIAFVAALEDDMAIGRMRLEGYKRALGDLGIPYRAELVLHPEKGEIPYTMESGYQIGKRFLDSGKEATVFLVISDNMAFGVCRALADAGKRVPEDYSVAVFDGIEMGRYYCPSLTTMKQPLAEMARESVQLLFDLIGGQSGNQHRTFKAELIEGQSVKRIG